MLEFARPKGMAQPPSERVAYDHLVMIRAHLESLKRVMDRATKESFSPFSIVELRQAFGHIRMIIEELMLLSVSAHKDAGEAVSHRLRDEYQAVTKMALLRAINPRFFPVAIDVVPTDEPGIAGRFTDVEDEYLTEKEAKAYYVKCGDILHASWKAAGEATYDADLAFARRFVPLTSRLLKTFEVDISGQGYMMLGHLNLGEPIAPALFFGRTSALDSTGEEAIEHSED
ncbi:hypothetical protein [Aurantimonas sp. 22II-16-19i]|uniref:hypothetical protein n=1 Tax=Aurantimonas sp. 22II-16-19i TaxID=1317114 RepID=UPI0009F7F184|nr:hypothetical protein [Aurantimonas sp. 22II-16-19i]ORE93845.1 hypothetical protein ATO4_15681 [Aurantimonas sp. 22II-16-19i]